MLAILGLQAIIIIILLVYIGHAYSQIKQLRKALESASVSYSLASSVSGTIPGNAPSEGPDCFPESSASSSGMFSEDEELFEHIHQTILSEKLFLNLSFAVVRKFSKLFFLQFFAYSFPQIGHPCPFIWFFGV